MPFEPGSPTTRLRQKVAATCKTATATAGTTTGTSEAQRKPTRSADVTPEVSFVTSADVKAAVWTPPVAAGPELHATDARKESWRPVAAGEELLMKRSPAVVGTSPGTVGQPVSVPPLPSLSTLMTSSSAAPLRSRSLYSCAVCGFDAGGYVELAQHMMTSHYSVMTSAPGRQAAAVATTPFKRRWPGDNDELGTTSWTPPPRLPTPRPVCHSDNKREFLPPVFPASSMPLFHQPSPPVGWGSYRSLPPVSTAFGSLGTLRAELDAMRSPDEYDRVRADDTFRTTDRDLQRGNQVKSSKSDVVDFPPRTDAPPQTVAEVSSYLRWHKTKPPLDYIDQTSAPASVASGSPLDLSTKASTLQCDQLVASVQSEVKRSRRKGKAFKVDAERVNSGGRDEDLADVDPVGRYISVTEMNGRWRITEDLDTAASERLHSSGGSVQALRRHGPVFTGDHDIPLPTLPRFAKSESSAFSCDDASQVTTRRHSAATSADQAELSSTPYHECHHCGLGFRDGELFAMHMDFHGRSDPFTCNFCGAATGNQVEFFLHVAHAPHNVRPVYVV